jgi:quinol monooxygenase YgiN
MKSSLSQQVLLVTLGITIGLLMKSLYKSYNVNKSTFFLGITIIFNTIDDKEEFKTLFKPLAKFVRSNEPYTLSYELCESDKDEKRVFLIERYRTKNDYLEVHRKSEPFLKFRGLFELMKEKYTMDGHSYIESNIGYV